MIDIFVFSIGIATTGAVEDKETLAEKRRRIARERRQKLVEEAKAAGMPTPVYSALKDEKIVLIFFWEPQGKDDERTNDAVLNLQDYRGSSLKVFREEIANKSKYDGIAQAGELTQTPSMVILYKDEATTAQGYMDSAAINAKITKIFPGTIARERLVTLQEKERKFQTIESNVVVVGKDKPLVELEASEK